MVKDLFSEQAAEYALYRPVYPVSLVETFLPFVKERKMAWDGATGNGQAARLLADFFDHVEASDISDAQLNKAVSHPKIKYTESRSEETPYNDHIFDLITVAQAYHWMDFDAFHQEVQRVAKADAVIAVWGYGLVRCEDREIDKMIRNFYTGTMGPYWDPERKFIDEKYQTVPFPYEILVNTNFDFNVTWNINQLCGYLNSWSSVRNFIKKEGTNPVELFCVAMKEVWQEKTARNFTFPIFLKAGKVNKSS
ncbi:MAG TPA: methyltransferase domain-containing protein [Flavitalea sp.]|nr:methyltransferase domain-containing protein [Flavitalea sp.]